MRREWASILIGIGLELIFGILGVTIESMPIYIAITGYVLGGIFIILGIVSFFVPLKKIWSNIMQIRLRSPIYIKNRNTREQTESSYDIETKHLGEVLHKFMNHDNARPDSCVLVRPIRVNLEHMKDISGPYLVFDFWVYNASVYTLKIDKEPTGHLIYEKQELKDSPEFLPGGLRPTLNRINAANIELRQFLLPELANKIMNISEEKAKKVRFDFYNINLPIVTIKPDGETGNTWKFPFPKEVSFELPIDGTIAFIH